MASMKRDAENDIDQAIASILVKDHLPFRHFYLPRLRGERGFAPGSSSVYELQSLQFCDREMTDEDCELIGEALIQSWLNFGPHCCSSSALRIISVANNALVTNRGVRAIVNALRETEGAVSALHTLDFTNIGELLSSESIEELVKLVLESPTLCRIFFTGRDEDVSLEAVSYTAWVRKDVYLPVDLSGTSLLNLVPSCAKTAILAAANCDMGVRTVDLSQSPTADDVEREFPKSFKPVAAVIFLASALRNCSSITVLDFSNNNIGDARTTILADVLKTNSTLQVLKLRNNEIATAGALSLFHALRDGPNQALFELDLTNNGVTSIAAKVLLDIVMSHTTAIGIARLEQNCISPNLMSTLVLELEINIQHPTVRKLIPKLVADEVKTTKVNLENASIVLDDISVRVLLRALRNNTHVTTLDLSNGKITDEGAFLLAEMIKFLPKIRKTICSSNCIGVAGAKRIMHAIPMAVSQHVEVVDLSAQTPPLDPALVRIIEKIASLSSMPTILKTVAVPMSENDPNITAIDLSEPDTEHPCSDNAIATLGVLLERNTYVDVISLANNAGRISSLSATIAASLTTRLRELDLSGNGFKDEDLIPIAEALVNPQCRLETLRLADNLLTNEFAHKVSMALRNHNDRMTFCDVSRNTQLLEPSDAAEVKYYCDLNTHTLAFKSLIRTLQDDVIPSLKEVNLCVLGDQLPGLAADNAFKRTYSDLSVALLCEALKDNRTVKKVNLSGNMITAVGARTLAAFLGENSTLTHLDISHNFISSEGLGAITQALRSNGTLKTLLTHSNSANGSDSPRQHIASPRPGNVSPRKVMHALKVMLSPRRT